MSQTECIYRITPDTDKFRSLRLKMDRALLRSFAAGKVIDNWNPPPMKYLSLQDDLKSEQELIDEEDGGDLSKAHTRFAAGVGDCVEVEGFVTSLVFSRAARIKLASILEPTGQLLPVLVNGEEFYFYNCTHVIHATRDEMCEVRCMHDGQPSECTKIVFDKVRIEAETVFKMAWPRPRPSSFDFSTIAPPAKIYATSKVIEIVKSAELKGFVFQPVGQVI